MYGRVLYALQLSLNVQKMASTMGTDEVDDSLRRTSTNFLFSAPGWYCAVERSLRLFLTYLMYCVMVIICD